MIGPPLSGPEFRAYYESPCGGPFEQDVGLTFQHVLDHPYCHALGIMLTVGNNGILAINGNGPCNIWSNSLTGIGGQLIASAL